VVIQLSNGSWMVGICVVWWLWQRSKLTNKVQRRGRATLARVQTEDIGLRRCLGFVGRLNVAKVRVSYRLSLSQPADCWAKELQKRWTMVAKPKPQPTWWRRHQSRNVRIEEECPRLCHALASSDSYYYSFLIQFFLLITRILKFPKNLLINSQFLSLAVSSSSWYPGP
jgi:hypothetical protein